VVRTPAGAVKRSPGPFLDRALDLAAADAKALLSTPAQEDVRSRQARPCKVDEDGKEPGVVVCTGA